MKIPVDIRKSIEKSSEHFAAARKHERVVRNWLDRQGFEDDGTHDAWIDNIEIGQ